MVLSNKEWLDKMDEIISAIQNGGGDSQVIEDMLSNMWISSVTYNVGDYVLYNNNIWKCLVQNSNIAPSEGTTWTRVNITSEISTLNSNLAPYIDSESQFELVGNFTNNSLQEYTIKDTGWYSFYCTTPNVNDVLRVMVANRAFYLTLVGGMTFLPIKAGTVIKIGGTTQYPIIVYKCV